MWLVHSLSPAWLPALLQEGANQSTALGGVKQEERLVHQACPVLHSICAEAVRTVSNISQILLWVLPGGSEPSCLAPQDSLLAAVQGKQTGLHLMASVWQVASTLGVSSDTLGKRKGPKSAALSVIAGSPVTQSSPGGEASWAGWAGGAGGVFTVAAGGTCGSRP